MAEGPRRSLPDGGGSGERRRRTPSLEKSQIPFFAGWKERSSSLPRLSSGHRSSESPSPSPQQSPFTIAPKEERTGSIFLGGNNQRVGIDTPMNDESGPDVSVQGAHNGEMGSEVPITNTFLAPPPSPITPDVLRRVSITPDDTSSGGERSDASSFAHMLVRKEMSKRSFKKLMIRPSHLALACSVPGKPPQIPRPSGPTILMESKPAQRVERPQFFARSLTFSEALKGDLESPGSRRPTSSGWEEVPQMPQRPRYKRIISSNEAVIRPVLRAGRGLTSRSYANKSTGSSNQSLRPASAQRNMSDISTSSSASRPHHHVSFATLKDVEEHESVKTVNAQSRTFKENSRRGSFPWDGPAREAEESRSTHAVETAVAPRTRLSVLARIRSVLFHHMKSNESLASNARSTPRRMLSCEHMTKASLTSIRSLFSGKNDKHGNDCFPSELFTRRRTRMENVAPINESPTQEGKVTIQQKSAAFAQVHEPGGGRAVKRGSVSYHGGDGKHYTIEQPLDRGATWLPSEMSRINTPPPAELEGRRPPAMHGPTRGFFFDFRRPPAPDDEEGGRPGEQKVTKTVPRPSIPLTHNTSYASTASSNAQTPLTPVNTRGTMARKRTKSSTRSRLWYTSSYDSSPGRRTTKTDESEDMYTGPADYFRQKVDAAVDKAADAVEDGEIEYAWDLPDHLPNSPLCPRNDGVYGGGRASFESEASTGKRLECPLHGRRKHGVSSEIQQLVEMKEEGSGVERRVAGRRKQLSFRDLL